MRINFEKYGAKTKEGDEEDSNGNLPENIYCHLVESLNEKCGQQSLLEIWRYEQQLIETTTNQVRNWKHLIKI